MKRLFAVIAFVVMTFGIALVPITSAQAITCAQRDLLLAQALSIGDIGSAASYRNMSCTSGSTSSGTTLTCAQRQLNIAGALTRGDLASAAYWQAASCTGSSSSSGGSSSSSGTVSRPPAAVLAPSCTSGPDIPTLRVTQMVTGVKFEVIPAASGQPLTDMQYTYNFWNTVTRTWSPWTAWSSMGTVAFSKVITPPSADITYVGFEAYSRNSCGFSKGVRESADNKGVKLINPETNTVVFSDAAIPATVGITSGGIDLADLVKASKFGGVSLTSATEATCSINGTVVEFHKAGLCNIVGTSEASDVFLSESRNVLITIQPAKTSITCVSKKNRAVKKKVSGINPKCPSGFVKT